MLNLAYDIIKVKSYTGNQVYTSELLKSLVRAFPENTYHLIINWTRKKEAIQKFGNDPALHYHNTLPSHLILGKHFEKKIRFLNQKLLVETTKKYDIYHATNPFHFPTGIKNGVVTLHDLISLRDNPWVSNGSKEFYRKNIRSILQQANLIFCVSSYTEQDALQHFPELTGKTQVTPLAAATIFKAKHTGKDFLKKYNISAVNKPYLLYVGEIQPRKNIDTILLAFDALPAAMRKSLQLIIIGSARSSENMLKFTTTLKNLSNSHEIYHLTNVPSEDLVQFYNGALCFIFPSFFEGFGLPVIEAMSCGCPVITSNTSSLIEVAADAAITVDPSSKEELREAMMDMIEHDSLRESYHQKGLERSKAFSWAQTAAATMFGYRKIAR
jgi:glycosyltransferase involved in cell wall biosynthesis